MQRPFVRTSAVLIKLDPIYPFENSGYASIPNSDLSNPLTSSSSDTRIPITEFKINQTRAEAIKV